MSGRMLQRQFSMKHHQVLEEVYEQFDTNNTYHKKIMGVVMILQKPPKFRSTYEVDVLEQFFMATYRYVSVLKDKLSPEQYLRVIKEIKFECFSENKAIFEAGDIGRKMYFVLYGEVGILLPLPFKEAQAKLDARTSSPLTEHNPKHIMNFEEMVLEKYYLFRLVATLKQGDFFGEVAIQNRIPRTGTVLTKTKVLVAVLTFETYQKYIQLTQEQINREKIEYLSTVSIFKQWPMGGLHIVLRNCEDISIKPFEYIFKRSDQAKYIYFIRKGEVKLTIYDENDVDTPELRKYKHSKSVIAIVQLVEHQHFGDLELYLPQHEHLLTKKINLEHDLKSVTRSSTVIALSQVSLIRMTLLQFLENYRIFGNLQVPKDISSKQTTIRQKFNDVRKSILTSYPTEEESPPEVSFPTTITSQKPAPVNQISRQNFYFQHRRGIKSEVSIKQTSISKLEESKTHQTSPNQKVFTNLTKSKTSKKPQMLKIFDTSGLKNLAGMKRIRDLHSVQSQSRARQSTSNFEMGSSLIKQPSYSFTKRQSSRDRNTSQNFKTINTVETEFDCPNKSEYIQIVNNMGIQENKLKFRQINNAKINDNLQQRIQQNRQLFSAANIVANQRNQLIGSWKQNKNQNIEYKFQQFQNAKVY